MPFASNYYRFRESKDLVIQRHEGGVDHRDIVFKWKREMDKLREVHISIKSELLELGGAVRKLEKNVESIEFKLEKFGVRDGTSSDLLELGGAVRKLEKNVECIESMLEKDGAHARIGIDVRQQTIHHCPHKAMINRQSRRPPH